jgi:aspartate aminotransferase
MSIQLSDRVQQIKPSATLAVSAKAAELRAQGKDVIGLGTGEPDFDTPEHIKQAAIRAMQNGKTKYTPVDGIPELKQAVINKFARDNDLNYEMSQVIVSVGAKQSIFNLALALLNAGDEVIIPAPYWVSYPDIALLAGAKPVIIKAGIEQQYKITPEQLAQAITPKTKLFILNSPSNPTGVAYTRAELAALGEVLLKHPHVVILSDDIYEHILWSAEPFCNILMACPKLYERTVVLNGVSKAYAMTGWRIGYAAGPSQLIAAMKKMQSQSTSNPTSIAQYAAVSALNDDQSCLKPMLSAFKERHDYVYHRLSEIQGVKVQPADGTFYSFPNVEAALQSLPGINDDVAFAEYLLNEVELALVPGTAFGMPGCIRLSYATSMEVLQQALDRFSQALQK